MMPSQINPASGIHPSLHEFKQAASTQAKGRLVLTSSEGKPVLNDKNTTRLGHEIKTRLASRQAGLQDRQISQALSSSRKNYFPQLNFNSHFSPFEHKEATHFRAGWIGKRETLNDSEKLEKWASNIHRLLLDGQHDRVIDRVCQGVDAVLGSLPFQAERGKSNESTEDVLVRYIHFVGDVLRNVPKLGGVEKAGFAFVQALLDELSIREDIGPELAAAIAYTFVDKLERGGAKVNVPSVKVSDIEHFEEKLEDARRGVDFRQFRVSWIDTATTEPEQIFSTEPVSRHPLVTKWLEGLQQLVSNSDYSAFQKRLQQAVDTVYSETEKRILAAEGTVSPEQVLAHPLWHNFRNLILSSFPEGSLLQKEKSKVRQLVVDIKPSPTKQYLIEGLIKTRAEQLQLKYLLQLVQEFESRGVALQGKVGLLELKTLEKQLEEIGPGFTPHPLSLWFHDHGIPQSGRLSVGVANSLSIGLEGDDSSCEIDSNLNVGASFAGGIPVSAANKSHKIEGESDTLGAYSVKLQAYGSAQVEGGVIATGTVALPLTQGLSNDINDKSVKPLGAQVGVVTGVGTKVGAKAVAEFKNVEVSGQSELWVGARGKGAVGVEAATRGVKVSAEAALFTGVEAITEGSVSIKSDFAQHAGLSCSVRLTKSVGAGGKANVHASVGNGGFSFGAGAGVTVGLGGHLGWSVEGNTVGSLVLMTEAAGKAAHQLGSEPYRGAISQYGRTAALDDRLTTLKERINHRLDALEVPDIQLQRQLDEGTFRERDLGTQIIALTGKQQSVLGDIRPPRERVADQFEAIRRDALNQHYS